MGIATELDAALRRVCPIVGVSIGDAGDKASWRIDFAPEATDEERQAAAAALAEFTPAAPSYRITPATLWRRCTPDEVLTMRAVLASFEQSMDGTEVQLAMVFRAANVFDSSDADFGALYATIAGALGEARADELLAPAAPQGGA